MIITYRTNYSITAIAVAELFRRSGIRRPVNDLNRIEKMLNHPNLTITAWDGDRLVLTRPGDKGRHVDPVRVRHGPEVVGDRDLARYIL